MGFKLTSNPSTVISAQVINATTSTRSHKIANYEGAFALQAYWTGGAAVNMILSLEFSLDGVHWAEDSSSARTITAASGSELWDMWMGSGVPFVKVTFTVTAGSATFSVLANGKGRD
jgi:hypothetical protein